MDIPIVSDLDEFENLNESTEWEIVVDGLFGFSFKPPVREPFDKLIPVKFKQI